MVFPDRPDWPEKADLRVSYFLPLASAPDGPIRTGWHNINRLCDPDAAMLIARLAIGHLPLPSVFGDNDGIWRLTRR